MPHFIPTITKTNKRQRTAFFLAGLLILALLVAACGGATTAGTGSSANSPVSTSNQARQGQQHAPASAATPSASNPGTHGTAIAGPYLIKALAVNMGVKDTRRVAADLQAWISTTDPSSSSAGIDYEQVGNNLYSVSMQFEVRATLYNQVKLYLEQYNSQHGGQLLSLHETIQDVTNDYIDTQSRLRNLRGEQQRLLTLLSSATSLGDTLSIEQRLTDVEGQIEDIEAHLNALNGQISFYTVTINLQPLEATPPSPAPAPWSVLATLQGAWAAALAFGQVLLTLLIWLLTFGIYIIPVVVIAWFIWQRRRAHLTAAPAPAAPTQTAP